MWRRVYVVNARTRNLEPGGRIVPRSAQSFQRYSTVSQSARSLGSPPRTSAPEERDTSRDGGVTTRSRSFSLSFLSRSLSLPVILHVRTLFFTVHPERICRVCLHNPTRRYQKIRTIVTVNRRVKTRTRNRHLSV